jgi:hypothetical protein
MYTIPLKFYCAISPSGTYPWQGANFEEEYTNDTKGNNSL